MKISTEIDASKKLEPCVARIVAAVVDLLFLLTAETHAKTPAGEVRHYTSSPRGPHPPGKSGHWCRTHFRSIPGAKLAGRTWILSVADFDAWASKRARLTKTSSHVIAGPWTPDLALEAANVRNPRGAR
jgi:hypothetical protein